MRVGISGGDKQANYGWRLLRIHPLSHSLSQILVLCRAEIRTGEVVYDCDLDKEEEDIPGSAISSAQALRQS